MLWFSGRNIKYEFYALIQVLVVATLQIYDYGLSIEELFHCFQVQRPPAQLGVWPGQKQNLLFLRFKAVLVEKTVIYPCIK